MKKLRFLLLSLLGAGTACQTVTDRMVPDADEAVPQVEGAFRFDSAGLDEAAPEKWWDVFGDATLAELIGRLNEANPDVAAALARVDQSFAILGVTRSSMFPTVRAASVVGRQRDSQNSLRFPINQLEYDRFRVGLSATWEVDLWGRVRALVERDRLRAQSEAVNYRNVLLSLQASLAEQYFAYRAAQTELDLLRQAESLAEEALFVQQARLELGEGVLADVAKVKLDLQSIAATSESARRNAGKLLHSIATLTGTMPSRLTELDGAGAATAPAIPTGVPSELMARRPDLMAADRSLRAAAQSIGISKADFLPKLTLVGSGAVASLRANNLFEADSGLFDVGPQLEVPIFSYQLRKNRVAEAKAAYREAAAKYRSAFLTAVREVDDALLDLRSFGREAELQSAALQSASESAGAAKDRYDRGLDGYLLFVGAEQVRLQAAARERSTSAQKQIASVRLIRALGGSWGPLEE